MNTSIDAPLVGTEGRLNDHPTIAILSPLIVGSYLSEVIAGVTTAADEAGARLVAIQTLDLNSVVGELPVSPPMMPFGRGRIQVGWPTGSENQVPHFTVRAAWDRAAGFIVILNAVEPWYLRALRDAGKEVVVVSDEPEGVSCPVVHADNRTGIVEAVSHLVEHGHRRIAFVGDLDQLDIRQRRDAYLEALAAHGIPPEDTLVFPTTDNQESGGLSAGRRMLDVGMPSTAVVAATDYNAVGVMRAFREAGLVLPRDQAITGFDDVQGAAEIFPALSTVHQSAQLTGRTAAGLLLAMLRGERVASGPHLVPAQFIARESCGCTGLSSGEGIDESDRISHRTPRERLRLHLQRRLLGHNLPTPEQTTALDRAVDLIGRHIAGRTTDPRSAGLAEAARMILGVSPRSVTISGALSCLLEYRRDLGAVLDDPQALGRYERTVVELGAELSLALQDRELSSRTALNEAIAEEHQLSLSLVAGSEGDPRSLGWLAFTRARAGCLGLWSAESRTGGVGERWLNIAGTYRRDGGRLAVPEQVAEEEFPPDGLFEGPEWAPGDIVVVVPVTTRSADLGLLAMLTGTDTSLITAHDRIFEESALASVAIERVLMTERLRRSNDDLATYSHAMAHDLRNPLATISMWASVARSQAHPGDPAEPVLRMMDRISEVARYANDLVVDLVEYSNLERTAAPMEAVDLTLAARQVLMTEGANMAAQGATVEVGELPTIRGRPAELEMVFQNLIENSVKYRSSRPPRIRLSAIRDGQGWKIRCRDNGEGIPADIRAQVFDPFVRGDAAAPGSGIGLATCRRIVEGHGGRIWVEASGRSGTTVAFTLPATPGMEAADGASPEGRTPVGTALGADRAPSGRRRDGPTPANPARRR